MFCFKKIDELQMVFRLDFSTIFIVCFAIVCRIVTIFDCLRVLLENESAEEDDPYASPAREPSASKSSLGRRHVIEVCPTRILDHPYSFCRVVSRGDPHEVINLGLAALDSQLGIASRLLSSTRILFSVPLAKLSHSQPSRIHQGKISHSGGSPADLQCSRSHWI